MLNLRTATIIAGIAAVILLGVLWSVRSAWVADTARLKEQITFREGEIEKAKQERDVAVEQAQAAIERSEQDALLARQAAQAARASLDRRLADLAEQRRETQTPTEIVEQIQQQVPGLPQPITLNRPAPTRENPNPEPVSATVPIADLKPLFDILIQGKETAARLEAATAQLQAQSDESAALLRGMEAQLDAANATIASQAAEITATQQERDEYKRVAKGGSFFQRVGRAMKYLAAGVVVGVVISGGI